MLMGKKKRPKELETPVLMHYGPSVEEHADRSTAKGTLRVMRDPGVACVVGVGEEDVVTA